MGRSEIEIISQLKRKYDLSTDDGVLALFSYLQSGDIQFNTPAGMDFDDEIYEKAMQIKEKQKNSQEEANLAKKKGKKDKAAKAASKTPKTKKGKKVVVYTKAEYRARRMMIFALSIVMCACFGYFGYYCYGAYQKSLETESLNRLKHNDKINDMYGETTVEMTDEEGQTKVFTVLDAYKSLYNTNKNLIGWLKIDDTVIDYPVMQTADNEFYLNHNTEQQPDKNGTLFLDASCDVTKPSTNYIIYGHNMRSGKMFGSLSKYKDESFCEHHSIIQFDTIYETARYEVMYAFESHIYNEDEVVFKYYQFIDANSEKEFDSYMEEMAKLSMYDTGVTAQYGDQLLTLSTCDYGETDGRFVIVAKRID